MAITVERISIFPVKGFNARRLARVEASPGRALPDDRRFAVAHGASAVDPIRPSWQPKTQFLNLMTTERLARLDLDFDPESGRLTVNRDGKTVARGVITTPLGRDLINQFLAAFVSRDAARGSPKLVEAPDFAFTDRPEGLVSIINTASVKDLERVVRKPVDPMRFRGNLLIAGAEPWAEIEWIGRTLAIGGARLEVVERIGRCAATNVDPASAERDMNIPKALQHGYGHTDCGVYARVVEGGPIAEGDTVTVA
ncbi:MAG: MOSC domain-containing protein [Azospirillaceae bacterium]